MDLAGKKGLIIKLRYIGDTLSVIPVVENLKEKAPDFTVDAMVNKNTEEVMAHHPDIRKLWVYDRNRAKKGIFSSVYYHIDLIRQLRAERYDFVIDFTHGDRAAFLSFMTGAPQRITYQNSSTFSHVFMNRFIHADPFSHHIVDYQLESLRFFGLENFKRRMNIHVPESLDSKINTLLSASGVSHDVPRAVIHPGARGELRKWQPERFAEIACRLKDTYQAAVILIGGPREDGLVQEVERLTGFPISFKSTALTLLELAALLKQCNLFIGNDSAPAHIAASVNCPNLVLFGPTFPHMWRPLSPAGEVVFKNVSCCGCRQESCIRPENNCMDMICVDEVWESARKLIGESWVNG